MKKILTVLLIAFGVASCGADDPEKLNVISTANDGAYTSVNLAGMDCVNRFDRAGSGYRGYGGITCNWNL